MDKIRYLGVVSNGIMGGAPIQQAWIMAGLDRSRFEPLAVIGPGDYLPKKLEEADIPYQVIEPWDRGINPANDVYVYWKLRSIVRRFRPHLIHVRTIKGQLIGRLVAMHERIPIVVYTSHGYIFNSAHPWWIKQIDIQMERYLKRITTIQIAVCEADRAAALQYGTADPDKIVVILNGVETERFFKNIPLRDELRRRLKISPEEVLVIFIGRFEWAKNPELMIEAFRDVNKEINNLRLIMIGEGPLRHKCEQLVKKLGLSEVISFLGNRTDLEDILPAGDIFALSSRYEGLPLSMLEAMAAGLPVVVPDVGGIAEVVAHQINGFIYPEGNRESLVLHLLRLARDPAARKQMGATNAELARQEFDLERVKRENYRIYDELIEHYLRESRQPEHQAKLGKL